ncbi:protein MIZU-KUSSEI 1 [Malania oleifera]|uniref:protein MIZU-KUSSEI 1 n=1 Tax=Malania oleifera TaxID=397392 RepID=UPI0025AE7EDE|nr:protein MIZU-KUSSEI 1 [Malania oleifera]
MAKITSLRRFLFRCFAPAGAATATTTATAKKRLSTSLRDDLQDDVGPRHKKDPPPRYHDSSDTDLSTPSEGSVRSVATRAPPRSSRSMVVGTIFGLRRGHVWFCVQHDRLSARPALLLELSMPVHLLVKEMQCGLVRIALECARSDVGPCPLRSVPLWTAYCNGRRVGSATRRKTTGQTRMMLKTMQSISVGAGVIPAGFGSETGSTEAGGEIMYMRANYECVLGSADSESFHLINPEGCPGQELGVFLLRTR